MRQRTITIIVILCLLVLFAQMALGSRRLSLTYDEPIYTAIGYGDLSTGDVAMHGVIGHPPLINLLTAWPLLLEPVRPDVTASPHWGTESSLGFSRDIVMRFASLERLELVTRLPVMWMAVLLAALVYRWARDLWGARAAALSLVLLVFDPTVLAHGMLNTTDMGLTLFAVLACFLLTRYLKSRSWTLYIAVGLALGASLASKASGLFWTGAAGLSVFAFWATAERERRTIRTLVLWLLRGLGWVLLAFMVLWASYLFELRPLVSGGLPIPAASHFAGLPYISDYMQTGQRVFLNGQIYDNGHWSYFPTAFVLKTPLVTLALLAAAAVASIMKRLRLARSQWVLGIAPGAYLLVAMLSALNIGHRHLLPVLPFIFVWLGQLGAKWWNRKAWRYVLAGAILAVVLLSLRVFPDYIAYFNVLAKGRGYDYLADSSVDWGQSLKALKLWMDGHDVEQVHLAAFSSLDPVLYGLDYVPIPPTSGAPDWPPQRFNPEPGVYAISAVPLQGIWVQDPGMYDWFRHRTPDEVIGGAILLYDLSAEAAVSEATAAMCANPVPLLSDAQLAEGFGVPKLRVVLFDCENAWLYPSKEGERQWIIVPRAMRETDWGRLRGSDSDLVFEQDAFWDHPGVAIFENSPDRPESLFADTWSILSPDATEPHALKFNDDGSFGSPLAVMDGPLTLMGVYSESGPDLELHTFWQVKEVPERPLSLMAHLLDANGTALEVADGLGVPISSWHAGDVIVQRHRFDGVDVPEGAIFEVGAYWLDTLERWPVLDADGDPVADRVLVPVR